MQVTTQYKASPLTTALCQKRRTLLSQPYHYNTTFLRRNIIRKISEDEEEFYRSDVSSNSGYDRKLATTNRAHIPKKKVCATKVPQPSYKALFDYITAVLVATASNTTTTNT